MCGGGYFGLGVTTPGGAPGCTPCVQDDAHCNKFGTSSVACSATALSCVCAPGYSGSDCSECTAGTSPDAQVIEAPPAVFCTPCMTALGCDPAASLGAVCLPGVPHHCVCKDASNQDPLQRCTCFRGRGLVGVDGACLACDQALGCYLPGRAWCDATPPASCYCAAGYVGDKCDTCDIGYIWDAAGRCVSCGAGVCGSFGTPLCGGSGSLSPVLGCACFNGFSGPTCATCTGCGIGGTCSRSLVPGAPWCNCAAGYTKSRGAARAAPCDRCAGSSIPLPGGACVAVTVQCGAAADVPASQYSGVCRCPANYVDPPPPGAKCAACAPGFVGPSCVACRPGCGGRGICAWRGNGATCVCDPGVTGATCNGCDTGYVGDGTSCTACPAGGCGTGGTCVWSAEGPICACSSVYSHARAGVLTSPCTHCTGRGSPLSCYDCGLLRCGAGSACAERLPGLVTCDCVPGTVRLAVDMGAWNATDTRAPCYPVAVAAAMNGAAGGAAAAAPPAPGTGWLWWWDGNTGAAVLGGVTGALLAGGVLAGGIIGAKRLHLM
jgi:Laminin EGF domain